jgi:hypothetical protein
MAIGVKHLNPELQNLDLIDLISERHLLLRSIIENLWNNSSDIYISNSEWFIMTRTYKKQPTISYVSKHVDISRQGTHKLIKSLEARICEKVGTEQLEFLKSVLKPDWGLK